MTMRKRLPMVTWLVEPIWKTKKWKQMSSSTQEFHIQLKEATGGFRLRNLLRIITICSKSKFKALFLPLMQNGSLERHLYPIHRLDV